MADGQGFTGQGPEREPASLIAGNYEIENPVFSPVWGSGQGEDAAMERAAE
jgi:hypothetical protein